MRKKLFLAFTLALLLVLVFCATAAADSSGQCGEHVYWAKDANGVVTISGTGPMWDYDWNSNPSPLESDQTVTAAVIESGVTTVGDWFFYECYNLVSVEFPETLASIGGAAFYGCTSLTSVELPAGLTSLGGYTFYGCTSLTSVELPASLTRIGNSTFSGCTSLTSIELPASLTSLGNWAFFNCTSLASIELPASLTSLGNWAFRNCTALEAVTVLNTDTVFGENVFQGASGNLTLYGYTGSTAENYATANSIPFVPLGGQCGDNVYSAKDANGVVTIIGTGPMWDYHWASNPSPFESDQTVTAAVIGSGVTTVGAWFFDECHNLASAELPLSLTSLGDGAFYGCKSLTSVELPAGLSSLGNTAFSGCTSLTSVDLPADLTSLGNWAFRNCTALEAVTVLNTDTVFGENVFQGASGNLTLYGYTGSTAESYAANNHYDFVALDHQCGDNVYWAKDTNGVVTISGTGPMWDYHFISNPSPLDSDYTVTTAVIENGVTTIGSYFFNHCKSLASLDFPAGLTSLGSNTFRGCTSLTSIELPASLTSIDSWAFFNCTSLASIELPASLTSLGNWAFRNCTALEAVTVLNTDTVFGEDIFQGTGENLTIFGYTGSTAEAYATANSIPFVPLDAPAFFLPAALTALEDEAFAGIAARSVVIPKTVTSITGDPFAGSQVTTIYGYPDTPAQTFAAAKGYNFVAITDSWLAAFRG